jgi:hypothetical protein
MRRQPYSDTAAAYYNAALPDGIVIAPLLSVLAATAADFDTAAVALSRNSSTTAAAALLLLLLLMLQTAALTKLILLHCCTVAVLSEEGA